MHARAAVALDDAADGPQTVTLDDGAGWPGWTRSCWPRATVPCAVARGAAVCAPSPGRTACAYVAPANPADVDLSAIAPGKPVALRGLGLNFFDHMALLTEGRGGRFDRTGDPAWCTGRPAASPAVRGLAARRAVPRPRREREGRGGRHQPRC